MQAETKTPTIRFGPESVWIDQLRRARRALLDVTPRFLELLRSAQRPDAIAVGEWSVGEVAAHMSHVSAGDLMVAKTLGDPIDESFRPTADIIAAAASFNAATLEGDGERD